MIMTITLPSGDSAHPIVGPAGLLEAKVSIPAHRTVPARVGIVCHPHSLQGGTMENKVVTTVQRAFRELGIPSIRFNFRGVGNSEGEYDAGAGETDDLLAVMAWTKNQFPDHDLILAGFSFGSYVAYHAANHDPDLAALISIAPPVTNFDFNSAPLPPCPWIVVQGDEDEVIDPIAVFEWIDQLSCEPDVITFKGTGHFFHGRLMELRDVLIHSLNKVFARDSF